MRRVVGVRTEELAGLLLCPSGNGRRFWANGDHGVGRLWSSGGRGCLSLARRGRTDRSRSAPQLIPVRISPRSPRNDHGRIATGAVERSCMIGNCSRTRWLTVDTIEDRRSCSAKVVAQRLHGRAKPIALAARARVSSSVLRLTERMGFFGSFAYACPMSRRSPTNHGSDTSNALPPSMR